MVLMPDVVVVLVLKSNYIYVQKTELTKERGGEEGVAIKLYKQEEWSDPRLIDICTEAVLDSG